MKSADEVFTHSPGQLVNHRDEFLRLVLLLRLRHFLHGVRHGLLHVAGDGVDTGTSWTVALECMRLLAHEEQRGQAGRQRVTHKGFADLYSSVSESSSSEY